jgi:peptide deformylase
MTCGTHENGLTMTHPIRLYGDPILRRSTRTVTEFDDALARLAADMIETMLDADGVGLAAPQIGVPKRVFVMSGFAAGLPDPEHPPTRDEERAAAVVVVNPVLEARAGHQEAVEGCLSMPGLVHEAVPRDASLILRYHDLSGQPHEQELTGRAAVVVQHETDHLDGVLFFDRLPAKERDAFLEANRRELAEFQRAARAALKETAGGRRIR